jgi:hypothetical protein
MFLYVRLSYLIIDTTYGIGSIKSSTIKKTAQKQYKDYKYNPYLTISTVSVV